MEHGVDIQWPCSRWGSCWLKSSNILVLETSVTSWMLGTNILWLFAAIVASNTRSRPLFPKWSPDLLSWHVFLTGFCNITRRLGISQNSRFIQNVHCLSLCLPHTAPATYCACHVLCLPLAKVKKKTGEILLTAKAFNGRVIVMWLNHCLLDAVQRNPDHQILVLTSVAMKLGWSGLSCDLVVQ